MTPGQRAALIAAAKRKAVPVASCVQASLRPDHLFADVPPEDLEGLLMALVVVLAEAADPHALQAVVSVSDDDGRPDLSRRDVMLRKAHTEVVLLVRKGQPVPARLRMLDREYRRVVKERRDLEEAPGVAA